MVKDLSITAKQHLSFLGNFGPTTVTANREVKGQLVDEDNCGCTTYLNSTELRDVAVSLLEVAQWLDDRANAPDPVN